MLNFVCEIADSIDSGRNRNCRRYSVSKILNAREFVSRYERSTIGISRERSRAVANAARASISLGVLLDMAAM